MVNRKSLLPKEVYKKVRLLDGTKVIAVLTFPKEPLSLYESNDGKHRASKLFVVRLESLGGTVLKDTKAQGIFTPSYIYRVGTYAKPTRAFSPKAQTCASGIHFFVERGRAVRWFS